MLAGLSEGGPGLDPAVKEGISIIGLGQDWGERTRHDYLVWYVLENRFYVVVLVYQARLKVYLENHTRSRPLHI